jgi:hypothetical protein
MASRGIATVPIFYVTEDGVVYTIQENEYSDNKHLQPPQHDVEESRMRLANVLRLRQQQKQRQEQSIQHPSQSNDACSNSDVPTFLPKKDDVPVLSIDSASSSPALTTTNVKNEVDSKADHDGVQPQQVVGPIIPHDHHHLMEEDEWCSSGDDDDDDSDDDESDQSNDGNEEDAMSSDHMLQSIRDLESSRPWGQQQQQQQVGNIGVASQQQRYATSLLNREQQLRMNQMLALSMRSSCTRSSAATKGNSSKAIPSQFVHQPSAADNAAKRAIVHHTGSHYHMAGGVQYQRGVRVKGVVSRHSQQGAKLQAARMAQRNMYDAREDARGERTEGMGRSKMKGTKKSKSKHKDTTE